jgi:hypothetical protein
VTITESFSITIKHIQTVSVLSEVNFMSLPVFTVGIVFILIALLGGNFKILGAEIPEIISSKWVRFTCLVFGIGFLLIAFNINPLAKMQDPLVNVDLFGGDLSTLNTDSREDCASKCQANSKCKAYTFKIGENICYLKDGETKARPVKGLVSGYKK